MNFITVDFQLNSKEPKIPDEVKFQHWIKIIVDNALAQKSSTKLNLSANNDATQRAFELCLRIVDEDESATLNQVWRGKENPTNVLSFPADIPDEVTPRHLGDIIICAPVIKREAFDQDKPVEAHWAHMVVHGVLHLFGYDHIETADAMEMEQLETDILTRSLGFPKPYQDDVYFEEPSETISDDLFY